MTHPTLPTPRVPNWFWYLIGIIGLGITIGRKLESQEQQNITTNYRLCRIEVALKIEPGQICRNR